MSLLDVGGERRASGFGGMAGVLGPCTRCAADVPAAAGTSLCGGTLACSGTARSLSTTAFCRGNGNDAISSGSADGEAQGVVNTVGVIDWDVDDELEA